MKYRFSFALSCALAIATVAVAQVRQEGAREYVLSDKVIGSSIENAQGESVSSIEQLILEAESGLVKYAVADVGGFMGMIGEHEVAIPWNQIQTTGAGERFVLKKSVDLKGAPKFDEKEFLSLENFAEWESKVGAIFGVRASETSRLSGQEAGKLTRPLILSDHLIETDIEGKNDEKLGSVEQLLIDTRSGQAAYAVVDVGGFLGFAEREIAVPWEKLAFVGDETIELAYGKDLADAPAFDEEAFLGMENLAGWEREVRRFFGLES